MAEYGISSHFSYDKYSNRAYDKHEFGVPLWRNMVCHRFDDHIAISYNGNRIAELHKNGDVYFVIPDNMTLGVTTRLNSFLDGCTISFRKKSRVSGIHTYTCEIVSEDRTKMYGSASRFMLRDRFDVRKRILVQQLNQSTNAHFKAADEEMPVVQKDETKYREFNKKLKRIKVILSAQARLQVHNIDNRSRYSGITEEMSKRLFGSDRYPSWSLIENKLDEAIMHWMAINDIDGKPTPQLVTDVLTMMFRLHGSESNEKSENEIRRINNACKGIQGRYLRRECITIQTSNNSMSLNNEYDPISELLPSN